MAGQRQGGPGPHLSLDLASRVEPVQSEVTSRGFDQWSGRIPLRGARTLDGRLVEHVHQYSGGHPARLGGGQGGGQGAVDDDDIRHIPVQLGLHVVGQPGPGDEPVPPEEVVVEHVDLDPTGLAGTYEGSECASSRLEPRLQHRRTEDVHPVPAPDQCRGQARRRGDVPPGGPYHQQEATGSGHPCMLAATTPDKQRTPPPRPPGRHRHRPAWSRVGRDPGRSIEGVQCRIVAPEELTTTDLAAWSACAAEAIEPNPFLEPEWLLAALAHLDESPTARLVIVEHDGAIHALAPVEQIVGGP